MILLRTQTNFSRFLFCIGFLSLIVGLSSPIAFAQTDLATAATNNISLKKAKNDVVCLKGNTVLQGLKSLNTRNETRATRLQGSEDSLQVLCAQYTQFNLTQEAEARDKLAADIQKSCDKLDRILTEFVYDSSEGQVEYSADNYGQLATAAVALTRFTDQLTKEQALAKDPAEEAVLKAVIQSTSLAAAHAKKLLATAPGGLAKNSQNLTKDLSANNL